MAKGPKHPDRIRASQRRAAAIDLKIRGYAYKDIGAQLGVSTTRAYELVNEGLEATAGDIQTGRDKLRAMEARRLEAVCAVLWPRIEEGDYRAIDAFHKNRALLFKLLGLELTEPAATENHLHVHVAPAAVEADREIMRLLRERAALARGDVVEGEAEDVVGGVD